MAARTIPGAGLVKGLGITLKTMLKPAATQQYPHERPVLEPRTRGVIALMDENCTVCMLCARECPDWCIYIDSHKETVPPAKEGGRARTRNVLDRFAIDFALCMYCGICVEVCPFDALWWSPEFEYAEYDQRNLVHEYDRPALADAPKRELPDHADRQYNSLRNWADTVVPPPPLEEGAVPAAEVTDALEAHRAKLAEADAAALEAEQAKKEAKAGPAAAPKLREVPEKPTIADVELEGETQMDQAVFDDLIEKGKSERMARAKAKSAWVKAEKTKLLDDAVAAWEAEYGAGAAATESAEPAAAPEPTLGSVQFEGEVEIDQAVYDDLIAQGKSERIARAKAKAAYVKAQKRKMLDGSEGSGRPDEERSDEPGGEAASGDPTVSEANGDDS
jgi:NADH-quinone oxidoreductase subunit I